MQLLTSFKKILFLFSLCLTTLSFSQNEPTKFNFPIEGLMKVQKNENGEPKRYNYIDFKEDTYALMLDDKNLYVFQAINKIDDIYILKQLTFGDHILIDNGLEKTTIKLKIEQLNENKYELSFIFLNRTEKIIIINN